MAAAVAACGAVAAVEDLAAVAVARRDDPPSRVMTGRSRLEAARSAESAANEVSVEESAVNAKANADVAPPVPANRKITLSKARWPSAWPTGFFSEPIGFLLPMREKVAEGRMRVDHRFFTMNERHLNPTVSTLTLPSPSRERVFSVPSQKPSCACALRG